MKKVLIAVDGSEGAMKGVDYAGTQFAGMSDLQITLLSVTRGVPPELWDDGHILNKREKAARQAAIDRWEANQKILYEATFQKAIETLTQRGINPDQIETKAVHESVPNVADCILTEAKAAGYQTLVIGRCGRSGTAHFLMGSIASSIINRGAGVAICVVG